MSSWGDRRASLWIDDVTGLFVGEVAEAYLMAATEPERRSARRSAVLVLAIDRLDAYRAAQGEETVRAILARVAKAVRGLTAKVGVVAAAYRNGLILLVGPDLATEPARQLGERSAHGVRARHRQFRIDRRRPRHRKRGGRHRRTVGRRSIACIC